ncbi:MAG: acyl-CoA thioesterase [Clostridia bacterium]|nr:acyl-CoA thioesterase [Clostridia bacterium]
MENYLHKVKYYETDKMGVTHHSNYIRWMEEARVDFLDKIGFSYRKLEEMGAISPVIGVECEYKISTQFDDIVEIKVEVLEFRGVKLTFKYTMTDVNSGKIVAVGKTKHCFLNQENKPIILKKEFPELSKKLTELVSKENN